MEEQTLDLSPLDSVLEEYKTQHGAVIPVLQKAQGIYGWLPKEVLEAISKGMNVPLSQIYGVVTFYSFFSMVPKGRHTIKVCLGTACYVRGTKNIIKKMKEDWGLEVGQTTEDRRFTLQAVRCLGACGLAPAVVIDEDTHGGVKPDKVGDILSRYE